MITSLVHDPDLNIKTYEDVTSYFKKNFPGVLEIEIGQALFPVDEVKRSDMTSSLRNVKKRLRKLSNSVNRLDEILNVNESDKKKKKKTLQLEEAKEIARLIKDIRDLAGLDIKIPQEAYGNIVSQLENLAILQDAHFQTTGEVSESHIKRAIESLKQIRINGKIDSIDGKIEEVNDQINKLNDGSLRFEDIDNLSNSIKFKGLNKAIAEKELELQEKRSELDVALRKAKIKHLAAKGIAGLDGKVARKVAELAYTFKESAWEPFRALKFMADISAWGVQAAPVVYNMMLNINIAEGVRQGSVSAAFADQKALWDTFYDTTALVVWDGMKTSSLYRSNSTLAREMLNDIKKRPAYLMAKRAKLQISETKSLTRSEEVFTSNIINKVPLFGAIKDVSEDTMVSTLNSLRMIKFEKFYDATNGSLDIEEYVKVAELINRMTGTTSKHGQAAGMLAYFMSAPKLLMSRILLMTRTPGEILLGGLDLKRSNGTIFKTEADRFVALEWSKMVAGYSAATFLLTLLPGLSFEDDPYESGFLRYRSDDLAVDATGGVGTLARTIMKSYMLFLGAPEGASYTTKEKISYLKNVQRKDGFDALVDGFLRYKLHPTISAALQLIPAEDFFGEPFHAIGDSMAARRAEATIRAFLPISFEQLGDDIMHLHDEGIGFDNALSPEARKEYVKIMTSSALQAVGMNTFRYDDQMADIKVMEFENEIKHSARPTYPKEIQNSNGNPTKDYFRGKYKKIWGDILGEMIKSRGSDASQISKKQYKAMNKKAIRQAKAEFKKRYSEEFKSRNSK
jgi:hypothetical protein